jgi:hypothetical protein
MRPHPPPTAPPSPHRGASSARGAEHGAGRPAPSRS